MKRQLSYIAGPSWVTVDVAYPVAGQIGIDVELDEELDAIAEKHAGSCSSSGSGFGDRDRQYEFELLESANAFVAELNERFEVKQ